MSMVKITKKITHQNPSAATSDAPRKTIVLPKPYRPQSFKPGNPGGPGRPKDDVAVKTLKKYTAKVVSELLNEMLEKPMHELRSLLADDNTTGLQRAIVKALIIEDWATIDKILDRCIGKVPQKVIGEGFENSNHTHLNLGDTSKIPQLPERIKALATRLSQNSSR